MLFSSFYYSAFPNGDFTITAVQLTLNASTFGFFDSFEFAEFHAADAFLPFFSTVTVDSSVAEFGRFL